jgi:hypothetical protein
MCDSDRRHFLRLSMVALGAAGAAGIAGAALAAEADPPKGKVYVCPPCGCAADGKEFPAPGECPECGMQLIEKPPAEPKLGAQDRAALARRAPVQLAEIRPARAGPGKAAARPTA